MDYFCARVSVESTLATSLAEPTYRYLLLYGQIRVNVAGFGGRNDVDDIIETYARMSATAATEALLHFYRAPKLDPLHAL